MPAEAGTRAAEELTMLFIDLEDFKVLDDPRRDTAGDEVLRG